MKKVLIYEANSNKAISIIKYLKEYTNYEITEVIENDETINIENYDYILPIGADSTYFTLNKYKKLEYCNNISMTEKELIVFDKPKMLKIAEKININIPKTYYKKEEIESFPIFYKDDFEKGEGLRGIAKTKEELPENEELIYQEYIETPSTYGVGFLAKDGEIITYLQHKEVISYPKVGGSAVVIEKFEDERLLKYTKKLLKEIDYNGWGLAEFKYCNQREDFVFMEINSKIWSSIDFMLINNPVFLKELLNVKYYSKKEKRLLFINYLFRYNFIDILKNLKYLLNSKIIKDQSLTYQVVRRLIPNKLVSQIKRIVK